jgi:hypothetical protein
MGRAMLEFLHGLFTLSRAAIGLVVLFVAVVIWRYSKFD